MLWGHAAPPLPSLVAASLPSSPQALKAGKITSGSGKVRDWGAQGKASEGSQEDEAAESWRTRKASLGLLCSKSPGMYPGLEDNSLHLRPLLKPPLC